MAFPILFDTFVEKVKQESESSAVALEDYQVLLFQQLSKIRGVDAEVDTAIDLACAAMTGAAVTCRDWSNKINSFNVLPRSRGDIEIENESVEKLIEKCEKLHDLVAENVKSIAAAKVMKQQAEIDLSERDAALTRQYVSDGYKLTSETLENFGLTYHGARLRLIEAGVWRMNKMEGIENGKLQSY